MRKRWPPLPVGESVQKCATHLSAATDGKLLKGADVVHEQVHEPQFVWEAYQDEEARGVQSHAVGLLLELLVELQGSGVGVEHKCQKS